MVTGDVADHGRPAQYRKAANSFGQLGSPVNVCPGNHDRDADFSAVLGRPSVSLSRSIRVGNWQFLFVDSSTGTMISDETGRLVDTGNPQDRLHSNGTLGDQEKSWLRSMCATSDADHIFIWLHHPPDPPIKLVEDLPYADEWGQLLTELPNVRGFGAGHTHVPNDYDFGGRPVFVGPSLKNNFDLAAKMTLPPGYRTYEFAPDGGITSDLHLIDDSRWPRLRLGRAIMSLFNGELTHEELRAIAARKAAMPTNPMPQTSASQGSDSSSQT